MFTKFPRQRYLESIPNDNARARRRKAISMRKVATNVSFTASCINVLYSQAILGLTDVATRLVVAVRGINRSRRTRSYLCSMLIIITHLTLATRQPRGTWRDTGETPNRASLANRAFSRKTAATAFVRRREMRRRTFATHARATGDRLQLSTAVAPAAVDCRQRASSALLDRFRVPRFRVVRWLYHYYHAMTRLRPFDRSRARNPGRTSASLTESSRRWYGKRVRWVCALDEFESYFFFMLLFIEKIDSDGLFFLEKAHLFLNFV